MGKQDRGAYQGTWKFRISFQDLTFNLTLQLLGQGSFLSHMQRGFRYKEQHRENIHNIHSKVSSFSIMPEKKPISRFSLLESRNIILTILKWIVYM